METKRGPMQALVSPSEIKLLQLARDIAADIQSLDIILETHKVSAEEWDHIKAVPRFQQFLAAEAAAWNSASNTHERVRLKAASAIEEWLPEAYAMMHSPSELLTAKTEVAKLVAKIAGMGLPSAQGDTNDGSRFSVTINLGTGEPIRIEKEVTPRVIEGAME